ncbi:MAG: hypothetical protein OEZ54_07470, partial [Gemmatimonadota bacterium]|nr:hypothetical protein [Gemmatimonadota bacterium]
LTSCKDSWSRHDFIGTWNLIQISGESLPYLYTNSPPYFKEEVLSGVMVFQGGDAQIATVTITWRYTDLQTGATQDFIETFSGVWDFQVRGGEVSAFANVTNDTEGGPALPFATAATEVFDGRLDFSGWVWDWQGGAY